MTDLDLLALRRQGALRIEGDTAIFFAHLAWFKIALALLRQGPTPTRAATPAAPWGEPSFEPVTGRYLRMDIEGRPHRVYVEEAGEGTPLLLLHTAGSDGRRPSRCHWFEYHGRRWRSAPGRASVPTKSTSVSTAAGWVRSTAHASPGSIAPSRSR